MLALLNCEALAGTPVAQVSSESTTNGLSGEQLWSNNCQRCHNLQSPAMFSPAQWQIIVHHMRVRANITGADQRAILEFLKSSSK
jgi:cytochrome c2